MPNPARNHPNPPTPLSLSAMLILLSSLRMRNRSPLSLPTTFPTGDPLQHNQHNLRDAYRTPTIQVSFRVDATLWVWVARPASVWTSLALKRPSTHPLTLAFVIPPDVLCPPDAPLDESTASDSKRVSYS